MTQLGKCAAKWQLEDNQSPRAGQLCLFGADHFSLCVAASLAFPLAVAFEARRIEGHQGAEARKRHDMLARVLVVAPARREVRPNRD